MARRSYLQRIAERAVGAPAGIIRPRRPVRAMPLAPIDEPAPLSPARTAVATPKLASPPEPPAARVAPPAGDARSAEAPTHAVPPEMREASPLPARPVERPTVGATPAVRDSAPAPTSTTRPTNARRDLPRRNVSTTPDPLVMALAAAMQWTSSDEPAATADRVASTIVPAAMSSHRDANEPPVGAPMAARKLEPSPAIFPPTSGRVSKLGPTPEAGVGVARPTASERFTEIHIGSVDVQIVPTAPPPPSPAAPPPAASTAPTTPLARGLTSRFGLRQS